MELFEEVYRKYFSKVYGFLYKLTSNRELAEELTQETFYQAFLSFHRFEGKSEISTWLLAIAKHVYYKYLKKKKRTPEVTPIEAVSGDEGHPADHTTDPAHIVQQSASAEEIRRKIDRIPEKYRDVVLLRIYGDMSFAEVGKALNISENSAKVIFFRAKKMLMEELSNELDL